VEGPRLDSLIEQALESDRAHSSGPAAEDSAGGTGSDA